MTSNLEKYLDAEAESLRIFHALSAIATDARDALGELPLWEKWLRIFWLLGPFILLIERTPADFWVSLLAIILL